MESIAEDIAQLRNRISDGESEIALLRQDLEQLVHLLEELQARVDEEKHCEHAESTLAAP